MEPRVCAGGVDGRWRRNREEGLGCADAALLRRDRAGGARRGRPRLPGAGGKLVELAREQSGFIGIESGFQKGFALAVSYWESLESIESWSKNARHVIAKEKGKSDWFEKYVTRIARVERVY